MIRLDFLSSHIWCFVQKGRLVAKEAGQAFFAKKPRPISDAASASQRLLQFSLGWGLLLFVHNFEKKKCIHSKAKFSRRQRNCKSRAEKAIAGFANFVSLFADSYIHRALNAAESRSIRVTVLRLLSALHLSEKHNWAQSLFSTNTKCRDIWAKNTWAKLSGLKVLCLSVSALNCLAL